MRRVIGVLFFFLPRCIQLSQYRYLHSSDSASSSSHYSLFHSHVLIGMPTPHTGYKGGNLSLYRKRESERERGDVKVLPSPSSPAPSTDTYTSLYRHYDLSYTMSSATAYILQRFLEAEGAFIHPSLQPKAIPSMGGGMGLVATSRLTPGTTIARLPFQSMITVKKARFNLAMVEVAQNALDSSPSQPPLPFSASIWSDEEFAAKLPSPLLRAAVREKETALKATLSSTDTMACYLALLGALYGRFPSADSTSASSFAESASPPIPRRPLLCFSHENEWMGTWIHTLPAQYDNLLELVPEMGANSCSVAPVIQPERIPSSSATLTALQDTDIYPATESWLQKRLILLRMQEKVALEQQRLQERYRHCLATLTCLQVLPRGQLVQPSSLSTPSPDAAAVCFPVGHSSSGGATCTLGHFIWAFNTVMSRGFYLPDETWALMPYVDYFNYALVANGTMDPVVTAPSMASSSSKGGADGTARQKKPHLRTAVVGRSKTPGVNQYCYEFKMVRPAREEQEQICLHYGAYSDFELLLWYGFTLRPSLLPLKSPGMDISRLCEEVSPTAAVKTVVVTEEEEDHLFPPGIRWNVFSSPRNDTSEGSCDHENDCDNSSLAGEAQRLHQLLPLLTQPVTRRRVYMRFFGGAAGGGGGALAEGSDVDEDYDDWCMALDRAYRLPLSGLSDSDGNYPTAAAGHTWLDEMCAAFLATPPLEKKDGCVGDPSCHSGCDQAKSSTTTTTAAAGAALDNWARQWAREQWPACSRTAHTYIASDCGLGVLGVTTTLQSAIEIHFGCHAVNWTDREKRMVVRAIAWMELYTWACSPGGHTVLLPSAKSLCRTKWANTCARVLSVDVWVLLRYLALEATEEALRSYFYFSTAGEV